MRKTLAVILCALMILPLAFVGISAAEPEVITTAEKFAGMAADGNYKLGADIAVAATYTEAFTGTFDGDGHTITLVDVPLFKTLTGATVSNLKLAGTAKGSGSVGALAIQGSNVTITKVTNNADVTSTGDSKYSGGIIGSITTGNGTAEKAEASTFTSCVNNGNVVADTGNGRLGGLVGNAARYQRCTFKQCINNGNVSTAATKTTPYVAGIAGSSFGGDYIECVNNGAITSSKVGAFMGGIVGKSAPSAQGGNQDLNFTKCVNNGKLVSGPEQTGYVGEIGGILGTSGSPVVSSSNLPKTIPANFSACHIVITLTDCKNTGAITGTNAKYVGGLIGYVYGISPVNSAGEKVEAYEYAVMKNCVNTGDLAGTYKADAKAAWQADNKSNPGAAEGTYVSHFIAYTNVIDTTIENCIGAGKLTNANEDYNVVFGLSSASASSYRVSGNKIIEGIKSYSWACDAYVQDSSTKVYSDQLTSTTDATTGAVTVTGDRSANRIALSADLANKVKVLSAAEMAEVLNPTGGNTDPGTTPVVTGDTAVWVLVIAGVSLLGMGIALKARKA
ncbi:MAG: hypothetical protein IJU46_01205 [Clostridia bacterium]|nr:hypothetical protein [Lachnospiraceae bacterium]MBQ7591123.1 hypothetical protein [Clostridia bacterium]